MQTLTLHSFLCVKRKEKRWSGVLLLPSHRTGAHFLASQLQNPCRLTLHLSVFAALKRNHGPGQPVLLGPGVFSDHLEKTPDLAAWLRVSCPCLRSREAGGGCPPGESGSCRVRKRQLKQARTLGDGGACRPVRPGELGYEKKWSCLGAGKGLRTVFLFLGLLSAFGRGGGPPTGAWM